MTPMISRPLSLEIALLGYFSQAEEHGYQIHRRHNAPEGLGAVWSIKQAQLYALLGKLEEEGYLSASIQFQETRPARRVYRITPEGQAAFQAWLESPVERPRQMRAEFQLKLHFVRRQGNEAVIRLLEAQRRVCQGWLEALPASEEEAGNVDVWLVGRFRRGQIQAMLDWLDLCQQRLAPANPD